MTAKYSVAPATYKSKLAEAGGSNNNNANGAYFDNAFSGQFELEILGYFPKSTSGLRLLAGWGGYTYQSTTVSYPEFVAQWAFRPDTSHSKGFSFRNYLGVRSWQVPVITIDGGNSSNSSSGGFFSHNPQMIGPMESAQEVYRWGADWEARLTADLSVPVTATNKDTVIDKIISSDVSYKLQFDVLKNINEDFSVGFGIGYKSDQIRYTPSGFVDSNSSRASLSAPLISIFGTYNF